MIRFLVIAILVATGLFLRMPEAQASILFPTPRQLRVETGKTFSVPVMLDSQGEEINVVELTLRYPPGLLEVVETSRGNSFLQLWAEEPTANGKIGAVRLAGGITRGSIVYNAEVISVLFRAKKTGTAALAVDPEGSSVLLNDGFGSKTSLTAQSTVVTITNAEPFTPVLTSETHPDESRWSKNRDFVVQWEKHPDAVYSFQITRDGEAVPDDTPDVTDGVEEYPALDDGVWHFAMKERLQGDTWSPVARRRVMIDGTPPEPFALELVTDQASGARLVSFHTKDSASGVHHYEALVLKPRYRWFPFSPEGEWTVVQNPINLDERFIISTIVVRAYDNAGNIQEARLRTNELEQAQHRFYFSVAVVLAIAAVVVITALFFPRRARKKHIR